MARCAATKPKSVVARLADTAGVAALPDPPRFAHSPLLNDWAAAVVSLYSSYYAVPLLSQGWPALATYASGRMAHFAGLHAGVSAVYDRGANTVTVTSPAAGSVTVSGAKTAGFTTYGSETSAKITLSANTPVTFTPSLLP